MSDQSHDGAGYWKSNMRLIGILMAVWALVSFGFGIILRPVLDGILPVGGIGLGFWFAQQGSIYVFLALIAIYAKKMNALDREYGVSE
ncbi:MAG: DUF4212 domain-containing protein [Magnetovibrionaceae bacterium]